MAIAYFDRMGGTRVHDASRVVFALDHYAPALVAGDEGLS
jgi:hypothetical protein